MNGQQIFTYFKLSFMSEGKAKPKMGRCTGATSAYCVLDVERRAEVEGNFSPEHSVYNQTLTCDGEAGVVAERMRLWLKRGCLCSASETG